MTVRRTTTANVLPTAIGAVSSRKASPPPGEHSYSETGNRWQCLSQLMYQLLLTRLTDVLQIWTHLWDLTSVACENEVLWKDRPKIFNNWNILRRIFGSAKEKDGTWRIKTNDEVNYVIKNKNTINYIKGQTPSWFGHVYRMTNGRIVKNYLNGSLYLQD